MPATIGRNATRRNFPRRRSPVPLGINRGISIQVLTQGNRIILDNPESRLTAMKSRLKEPSLGNKQRTQLGERAILTAFQVGRLTNLGRISPDVLRGQTFGKFNAVLYRTCLNNLIRKGKIIRHGKDWVRTHPMAQKIRHA